MGREREQRLGRKRGQEQPRANLPENLRASCPPLTLSPRRYRNRQSHRELPFAEQWPTARSILTASFRDCLKVRAETIVFLQLQRPIGRYESTAQSFAFFVHHTKANVQGPCTQGQGFVDEQLPCPRVHGPPCTVPPGYDELSKKQFNYINDSCNENCTVLVTIIHRIPVRGSRPGKTVQMTESEVRGLCLKSREIFLQQPILLELEAPLKICGKFHDFLHTVCC